MTSTAWRSPINLGKHLPGNPNIILQHMPGAGGAKAMNWAYNVAHRRTGMTMIVPLDNGGDEPADAPGENALFDAQNVQLWLGSSNQTNVVMVVRSDARA